MYTTRIGGAVSILCAILLISFSAVKMKKLVSQSDPVFSMTTLALDEAGPIDLFKSKTVFALSKIDETLGVITVQHVS